MAFNADKIGPDGYAPQPDWDSLVGPTLSPLYHEGFNVDALRGAKRPDQSLQDLISSARRGEIPNAYREGYGPNAAQSGDGKEPVYTPLPRSAYSFPPTPQDKSTTPS